MIITEANDLMQLTHNRISVILSATSQDKWLNQEQQILINYSHC
ncbi:hypothetical protein [Terribacillus sp. JSM ZJ617]